MAADAGLEVSDAAIEQVLTRGGGSARDTLSALELVASTGDDGITNLALDEFVEAMIDRDAGSRPARWWRTRSRLGTDSRTLTEELIGYLRNGFLSLMAPELVQLPSHRLDGLAEQAQRLGAAGLVRGIELLGAGLTEMRHAPDPRVLLDVATVQLTADSVSNDTSALVARLDRIERQLADGVAAAPAPAAAPPPVDPSTGRAALGGRVRRAPAESPPVAADGAGSPARPSPEPLAQPVDTAQPMDAVVPQGSITAEAWENTVRPSLKGMPRAIYAPATFVRSGDGVLTLSVPNAVHREKCEQHRAAVEKALGELRCDGDHHRTRRRGRRRWRRPRVTPTMPRHPTGPRRRTTGPHEPPVRRRRRPRSTRRRRTHPSNPTNSPLTTTSISTIWSMRRPSR